MGLSSSQGRLLMLTSRLSDIELQEILISQKQNQLASQKTQAAQNYSEAMNNYKLTIKMPNENESGGYSKQDVEYSNLISSGYLVTNADGEIYLPTRTGEEIIASLESQIINTTDETEKQKLQERLDDVKAKTEEAQNNGEVYKEWNLDGNELLTLSEDKTQAIINGKTYNLKDGNDYLNNKKVLQNLIMSGMIFLHDTKTGQEGISAGLLESDTQIEYIIDTSDDAAAESIYNYELARLEAEDNKLDLELQSLETQHEAVMKEYDSVKEVISSNVERTFKLFSDG
ncbi:MAG: hypothetical protein E7Z90_05545 [Cyanobacteria bacterium SIG29]|nr:hypothetical protein [Cyanobacteria bacterium SIG29]